MTLYQKIRDAVIVLALITLVVLYVRWHAVNAKVDADITVRNAAIATKTEAQETRGAALVVEEKKTAVAQAAVKTPLDASKILGVSMPTVTMPEIALADGTEAEAGGIYLAPSVAVQMAKDKLSCDLTQKKLDVCAQDFADEQAKFTLAQQNTAELQTARNGGNFLHQTWTVAKPVACGSGAAYVAVKAGADAKWTAISTGAAALTCALLGR